MIIIKDLVKKYIPYLTINDIEKFLNNKNIIYEKYELNIILDFIKKYYNELLDEKKEVFITIKDKISYNTYHELLKLYDDYIKKYK